MLLCLNLLRDLTVLNIFVMDLLKSWHLWYEVSASNFSFNGFEMELAVSLSSWCCCNILTCAGFTADINYAEPSKTLILISKQKLRQFSKYCFWQICDVSFGTCRLWLLFNRSTLVLPVVKFNWSHLLLHVYYLGF